MPAQFQLEAVRHFLEVFAEEELFPDFGVEDVVGVVHALDQVVRVEEGTRVFFPIQFEFHAQVVENLFSCNYPFSKV